MARGGWTGNGFKAGQSGNPGGRPKTEVSLTAILRKEMAKKTVDTPEGKIAAHVAISRKVIGLALSDKTEDNVKIQAIKYIFDRLDGKPIETKQVSGLNGGPIATLSHITNESLEEFKRRVNEAFPELAPREDDESESD